ncbi:MAG: hypothetical protein ACI80K_003996 [Paracoccaceae bacterium]|jgi:hypothetical protein
MPDKLLPMARLFVLSGNLIGTTFDLFETSTVGRGDDADIVIAEASISRSHARLVPRPDPGKWKVVDLKSSNGVFVGGKRVTNGIISDGDTFRLGEIELRLRDDAGGQASADATTKASGDGFEDYFGEDDEDHDGEEIFPGVVEGSDPEMGDEFELEFGDDLDDAITTQTKASRASDAPAAPRTLPPTNPGADSGSAGAPGSRAGARATAQRSQRRQDALKGASVQASAAVAANPAGAGRQALQYSAAKHSASGADLAQMSGAKRALIILLGVAFMAGLAYAAFSLTRTARDNSAAISDPE